jgi:multiple sugar transport system permease protein
MRLKAWVRYGLTLAIVLLFVLPLYWVVMASLGETGSPPTEIPWWQPNPQWQNYREIFEMVPLARQIGNSLWVVVVAVPLTLLTASFGGFAMAQLPDAPRRVMLWFSLIALVIPPASVWIFRFQVLKLLQLVDSLGALMIPALAGTTPLFVLLFYWAFRNIPNELFEAARLEGANALHLWSRIALPLAIPTTVTVAVLCFALYWSDFVGPVLYLYDPQTYTLPIGLQLLNQLDSTNWPLLMAGAVVMTAPIIGLVLLVQRLFLHEFSLADLFGKN